MANHHHRILDAEEEALYRSYPYSLYFVQSPSTASHATSADLRNTTFNNPNDFSFHSPIRPETFANNRTQEVTARSLALSRYSSSRGSNNSFLHEKKIAYDDLQSHGTGVDETISGDHKCLIAGVSDYGVEVGGGDDDDDEEEEEEVEMDFFGRKVGRSWWRYLSFRTSSSLVWFCLQISWRFLVSLGVALLVFYIATKPPPPTLSLKIAGVQEFGLGEGVDATGVTTKILTCNCTIDLLIENKSKLFGLHLHPPLMELSFANLPLAISYGAELYAGRDGATQFQLYVATRNKPMYGAGREMQDLLDMRRALPLAIRASLRSSFRVVPGLIKPKFHHKAECVLVLGRTYDKKHSTQAYSSSCIMMVQ